MIVNAQCLFQSYNQHTEEIYNKMLKIPLLAQISKFLTTRYCVGKKCASGEHSIGLGLKLRSLTGQVNHWKLAKNAEK